MNIPNLITIVRILLVPLNVWLLIAADYGLALLVFALAGASDAVDGWMARVTETRTELGAYLDPLADKLLMVSTFTTLGIFNLVPAWLVILVISRDVLIVGGLVLAWVLHKPFEVKPLMISKVTTVVQVLFLGVALAQLSFNLLAPLAISWGALLVALLTALSLGAYMKTWFVHMGGAEA